MDVRSGGRGSEKVGESADSGLLLLVGHFEDGGVTVRW